MDSEEKLLEMLSSTVPKVRMIALNQLLIRNTTSEAVVRALEGLTYDSNPIFAEKAEKALNTDVHRQMAIEMGIVVPESKDDRMPLSSIAGASFSNTSSNEYLKGDQISKSSNLRNNLIDYDKNIRLMGKNNWGNRPQGYSLLEQVTHLSPSTHVKLMTTTQLASFGLPFLFLLTFCLLAGNGLIHMSLCFLFYISLLFSSVIPFITWKLPVYCSETSCISLMDKSKERISAFRSEVRYQCRACHTVFTTTIFDPQRRGSAH
jgi:hypothetical protein